MIQRFAIYSLLLFLTACGGGGGSSDSAPTTRNAHPPGWIFAHDTDALEAQTTGDLTECQVCHRQDLRGGEGVPSCFQCHILTPDFDPENPRLFLHPPALFAQDEAGNIHIPQWASPINHGRAAKSDIQQCQGCHGRPGGPGSNPRFDVTLRTLDNGCESTQCHGSNQAGQERANYYFDLTDDTISPPDIVGHNDQAAHPASGGRDNFFWFAHPIELVDAELVDTEVGKDGFDLDGDGFRDDIYLGHFGIENRTACTLCHGLAGEGGAGPACSLCHLRANPIRDADPCVSCHSGPNPPGPTPLENVFENNADLPDDLPPELTESDFFKSYIQNFESENHVQHQGFFPEQHDETSDCKGCHDITYAGFQGQRTDTVQLHHGFINQTLPEASYALVREAAQNPEGDLIYGCITCHGTDVDAFTNSDFFRQCICCHFNRPDPRELKPLFPPVLPPELQREAVCGE